MEKYIDTNGKLYAIRIGQTNQSRFCLVAVFIYFSRCEMTAWDRHIALYWDNEPREEIDVGELKIWFTEYEIFIAKSAIEANDLHALETGEMFYHDDDWDEWIAPTLIIEGIEKTTAEWIGERGKGYLCHVDS